MIKRSVSFVVAVTLVFVMGVSTFAADASLWTKMYKAEDGSILTITCLNEDEGGNYTVNLDGKIFTDASFDGLSWHLGHDGKSISSSDGKLGFNGGQLYAPFIDLNGAHGIKTVGNEEGLLLQSDNDEDTNFYLATLDETKNADSSTVWYKIIKTYRLIEPKITAVPTSSSVFINGKKVSFAAYNIDNTNYFKLRDLAYALNGSKTQFEVTWDGTNNAINLLTGKAYTTVGGELVKGSGKAATAVSSSSAIYKDGKLIDLTAYTINANNYFKLRDIGNTFGFKVTWDGANNAIIIDTGDVEYVENMNYTLGTYNGTYTGYIVNNLPNGLGSFYSKEADGTFVGQEGSKFTMVGTWINGHMNGQGTITWDNGEKYIGQFINDKREGKGTMTYEDGDQYTGEFKDDEMDGQGTYVFKNGEKYIGQFENDEMNGQGTYLWTDGTKYVGEFKNSVIEGQGTMTWTDGTKYTGQFKNNLPNGQGTMIWANGTKYTGKFVDGQFVD